jgi:hypothetical protein
VLSAALLTLVATAPLGAGTAGAAEAAIGGVAFQDLNGDGQRQADEPPFVDHLVYLYNASGTVIATRRTAADGSYQFDVGPGTYRVAYAPTAWRAVWSDWVPTNTGSLRPEHADVTAGATADFAWRPIVKSDDVNAPISQHVGAEGLRVQSYNDVVDARAIHEHITEHFLVGDEAPSTTVRFGYRDLNTNSTAVYRSGGEVTRVTSVSYSSYERWLSTGDRTMAHEYGHAWSDYHMYMNWDDGWRELLEARGLAPDDERLGSSHAWHPSEIAAEDYRQLFTSANARAGGQMNHEIPPPGEVEGYAAWLEQDFVTSADPEPGVEPEPDPASEPEPGEEGEPAPAQEDGPEPTPEDDAEPSPTSEVEPEPEPEPDPELDPEPGAEETEPEPSEEKLPPGRDPDRTPPGRSKK